MGPGSARTPARAARPRGRRCRTHRFPRRRGLTPSVVFRALAPRAGRRCCSATVTSSPRGTCAPRYGFARAARWRTSIARALSDSFSDSETSAARAHGTLFLNLSPQVVALAGAGLARARADATIAALAAAAPDDDDGAAPRARGRARARARGGCGLAARRVLRRPHGGARQRRRGGARAERRSRALRSSPSASSEATTRPRCSATCPRPSGVARLRRRMARTTVTKRTEAALSRNTAPSARCSGRCWRAHSESTPRGPRATWAFDNWPTRCFGLRV